MVMMVMMRMMMVMVMVVLYLQVFGDGVMSSVCDDEDGVSAADQRVSGLDPAGVPVCDARSHEGQTQRSVIGLIELPEREQSQDTGFTVSGIKLLYNQGRIYLLLPKVLAPLLMTGLTTLVISMSTNLNVEAYNDILGNLIVYQQFGLFSILT